MEWVTIIKEKGSSIKGEGLHKTIDDKFYCMAPPNYKCGRSVKDVEKFTEGEVNNQAQRARLGLCGQRPKGSRSTKWKVSFCPLAQSASFPANKEDPVLQKSSPPAPNAKTKKTDQISQSFLKQLIMLIV